MGPPPATRPTPTSHCESTAFSRLTKVMSQASAISLPFPVARPLIEAIDTTGASDAKRGYGRSVEYTMNTLFSFVQHFGRKNLVLVVLGDHQPATTVSGQDASHDVPISVIAHNPAVLRRIHGWGWVDGMRPSSAAPVWPMSAFRDRFLRAFGSPPVPRSSS